MENIIALATIRELDCRDRYQFQVPVCPYCGNSHYHSDTHDRRENLGTHYAPCSTSFTRIMGRNERYRKGDYVVFYASSSQYQLLDRIRRIRDPWRVTGPEDQILSLHHEPMSATKAHVEALRKYGVAELHNERLAQLARI
jgi:hypothetical protein